MLILLVYQLLSFNPGLNQDRGSSLYLSSNIQLEWYLDCLKVGTIYFFNSDRKILFKSIYDLSDQIPVGTIIDSDFSNERYNQYRYKKIFDIDVSYKVKKYNVTLKHSLISESEEIAKIYLYQPDQLYSFLRSRLIEKKRLSINTELNLEYHVDSFMNPVVEFHNLLLPLSKVKNSYFIEPEPLFLYGFNLLSSSYKLKILHNEKMNYIEQSFEKYKLNFSSYYGSDILSIELVFPKFNIFNMMAEFRYRNVFNYMTSHEISQNKFDIFQNNFDKKNQLSLKLSYDFSFDRLIDKVDVISVYHKKENFVVDRASDPAFSVELLNRAEKQITISLKIVTGSNVSQSVEYIIESNEMIKIEHFLPGISEKRKFDKEVLAYEMFICTDRSERKIAQGKISIYGKNIWNGETNTLYLFCKTGLIAGYVDSLLKENNYLQELELKEKYEMFKRFVAEIGKNLNYRNDKLTNTLYDYVKYPSEFLSSKYGDCEDFIVFYISCFSHLGIETELIVLEPEPQREGHLFLLIDTGLPVKSMEETNLNEFNSVIKENRNGNLSLWVPLELTLISRGYDIAHERGTAKLQKYLKLN